MRTRLTLALDIAAKANKGAAKVGKPLKEAAHNPGFRELRRKLCRKLDRNGPVLDKSGSTKFAIKDENHVVGTGPIKVLDAPALGECAEANTSRLVRGPDRTLIFLAAECWARASHLSPCEWAHPSIAELKTLRGPWESGSERRWRNWFESDSR